jgi:hypothetical protein
MYVDISKTHIETQQLVLRVLDLFHLLLQRHGAFGAMSMHSALSEGGCWSFVHHLIAIDQPNIEPHMAGIWNIIDLFVM